MPEAARKFRQLNKALWLLETTSSGDAADLKAELDTEWRLLFKDSATYEKLMLWDRDMVDVALCDPLLKRQLNVLIRAFKQNQIPKTLVEEIATKEAALSQSYGGFRPQFEGKGISENEVLSILATEDKAERRKQVWEASKSIGEVLAPQILSLVAARNKAAKSLGYADYFTMQLDLQEVDELWLIKTLDELTHASNEAYREILNEIEDYQSKRFNTPKKDLGPWAWSDPFSQSDPQDTVGLDLLVEGVDIIAAAEQFYQQIGIDVQPILQRSDNFERPGKNQHAFCINIDRGSDVRTLNNVKQSIKWLETVLHELGHAIYELGFDEKLPWLLREPPHMITTEAMALLAGRQAYRYNTLCQLVGKDSAKEPYMRTAEISLRRRQLIFSRWVLVMTHFERELYRDPSQDLNQLWWQLVEKYQLIKAPKNRAGKHDWAAKYHIGLAPVYYFSYLLGEMFASSIEEVLLAATGSKELSSKQVGALLQQKLFHPGNRLSWHELVKHVTGKPLNSEAWVKQFATRS